MADAGDNASKEFSSEAAYNNPSRFLVPTTVNNYAALELTRTMLVRGNDGVDSPILSVPSTNDLDHLFFVDLWQAGTPAQTNMAFLKWGATATNTGCVLSSIRTGSVMAGYLNNMYDYSRVRCIKVLFEPIVKQPVVNYPPVDVYVWWVPNHYNISNGNLNDEFDSFATFRDAIRHERITKVANHAGQSFAIRFVPQISEVNSGIFGTVTHDIPMPWIPRGSDPALYSPIVVFRRPFGVGPSSTGYSVTFKTVLEFKEANPNDEN